LCTGDCVCRICGCRRCAWGSHTTAIAGHCVCAVDRHVILPKEISKRLPEPLRLLSENEWRSLGMCTQCPTHAMALHDRTHRLRSLLPICCGLIADPPVRPMRRVCVRVCGVWCAIEQVCSSLWDGFITKFICRNLTFCCSAGLSAQTQRQAKSYQTSQHKPRLCLFPRCCVRFA
jgi:hypothetical protein